MLQEIERTLRAKCEALRAAGDATVWRFYQGMLTGAQAPAFDDGAWAEVRLAHTWSGAAGDAWFRRSFTFPEVIEGIATAGARVELPVTVLIHSALYVNGLERVAEPSWLDTTAVPLVLCEKLEAGQSFQVTLRAYQGDGFGVFFAGYARLSTVEAQAVRLEVLRNQMHFTRHLAYASSAACRVWQAAWQQAAQRLDWQALAENQWESWWQSVAEALQALAPMAEEAKRYVTHLVGHAHIDMNWLWTWEETVDVIRRDFATMDKLMERYPDFHFSQSQAATYQALEERDPALLARLQERVKQGQWEVTASTWVEGDVNMACGESLVRHLLLTRPYIERLFGVRPRICWEPDTFGHAGTLPQLLKQAGVDYYYFCRAGKGQPLFWWEGLDGSRVLAFNDPLGYNGAVNADAVVMPAEDLAKRYSLKRGLFLYGVGDHGGGATARDIEMARTLDATPLLPRAQMSDLVSFYDEARENALLPVIRGELNTTFEGCYTTHADIKKLNRQGESALLTAESLATMAQVWAGKQCPTQELTEGWRTLLFHHFHDILCGAGIGATYQEATARLGPVVAKMQELGAGAAAELAAQVHTGLGEGARCVVWNPLGWARSDLVRLPQNAFGAVPAALVDEAGQSVNVQAVGGELLFVARDVPALGCRVYRASDQAKAADLGVQGDGTLENALLRLHVHAGSGAIDKLVDREHHRTVDTMSTWQGVEAKQNAGLLNRLQLLWEEPHPMSAWNIGDITRTEALIRGAEVRVTEQGPVRATVEVKQSFLHSRLVQRYHLYTGLRRVDVETELDWHERGTKDEDAPMLQATFKPALGPSIATFEVPFAGLERTATGDEVPALRWADLSDGEYGLGLLNDGKYGHQAHGNTLGITLVRAPYEPDNLPDQGWQRFTYALYPHAGDWRAANVDRRAAELNQGLVATMTTGHEGTIMPGVAWLECDARHVMITAVKMAEAGGQEVIVRLAEMQGREGRAKIRWGWKAERVQEVSVLEEHLRELAFEPQGCEIEMRKHKIVTLKVTVA